MVIWSDKLFIPTLSTYETHTVDKMKEKLENILGTGF